MKRNSGRLRPSPASITSSEKKESAGQTKTSVRPLNSDERTREIACMISGAKLTDTSLKHAEQMLRANR